MISKLMTGVGAFLMALCGGLIGNELGGNYVFAMAGFGVGVILMAQAPTIVLRKRVEELERKRSAAPAESRTFNSTVTPGGACQ